MKKNVWKYGFLSGLALAVPMGFSVPLEHRIGASWSMAVGYTIMVLSFLIVFVGVKHYRDTECGGSITFRRPLAVGVLITAGVLRRKQTLNLVNQFLQA